MRNLNDSGFADRLNTGAKAKAAQLERAHARLRASQAAAPERDAARRTLIAERDRRAAERTAAKAEAVARMKAQRAAEEAARLEAEQQAATERKRKADEDRARLAQILIDQKNVRDARYAARKARSGGKK